MQSTDAMQMRDKVVWHELSEHLSPLQPLAAFENNMGDDIYSSLRFEKYCGGESAKQI